jgi:fatty acid desaturase
MSSPAVREPATPATEPATGSEQLREETARNDIPFSLKATLVDDRGVPYREFRRGLTPRWGRLWLELGGAYLVLGATVVGLLLWSPGLPLAVPAAIAGAAVIGYTMHFINLFFHEAAHYNIVPGRARNDLVANLLLGWLFGSSVALYRRIHFQHHRELGTTMDSENSYFDALRVRYLAEGLVGLKVLRTLRQHRETEASLDDSGGQADGGTARLLWLGISAIANLGIAAALFILGSPVAAIAWLAGLLVVFPFLASLRTLLEHRSEEADPLVDYHRVDHGPTNRLFGSGPLASTLGSAGFNRHAIHHWEPQVSYTRLVDIEDYLLRTDAAPLIRERQTSYANTFLRLLEL